MSVKEVNIMRQIMVALSNAGVRIFRNNVAKGWVGKLVTKKPDFIVLKDARVLHAGLIKGSPDLIGWKPVRITQDMVGKRFAIFVGIEVKGKRTRVSKAQKRFLKVLEEAGAIAGIARSESDAIEIVSNLPNQIDIN